MDIIRKERDKPTKELRYPALSKRQLADAYGCTFKTIKNRLERRGIKLPKNERYLFPALVESIINELGVPPGLNLPMK